MSRIKLDWARIRMNQREEVREYLEKFSDRKSPREAGFFPYQVVDAIEKEFGKGGWGRKVAFGQAGEGARLFAMGMLHEDVLSELKRTHTADDGVPERLYLCVDEHQQGKGDKLYKAVEYLTAGDWDNIAKAAEIRRANALRQKNSANHAAQEMRTRGVTVWKEVPADVRRDILRGYARRSA